MKVAVVTGANRGLGLETVRQLLDQGFKVYFTCRDLEKGQEAALSLGVNAEVVKLDVTKTKDIRALHDMIRDRDETIDVLINNAGVFLESSGPTDISEASVFKVDPVIILKTIETNTMGPLKIIQSLLPLLSKDGRIINISSMMGALEGMGGNFPGYRMSKTSLNALTKIVHAELSGGGITVNSVCPGWCKTDMGGSDAHLTPEQGVESIIWLSTMENPPSGKFIQGKKEISY